MATGTLNWYADRGFELDAEASAEDVSIRLTGVPVPADGTVELREGVDLDRIEILFKATVSIQGEIGQLHGARVRLMDDDGTFTLEVDARCEDIETGDLIPVVFHIPIALPRGVPDSGGPRPSPTNEDDLDFEDETTLEQLVMTGAAGEEGADEPPPATPHVPAGRGSPEGRGRAAPPAVRGQRAAGSDKGIQALFAAMARLDDPDDEIDESEGSHENGEGKAKPVSRSQREAGSDSPAQRGPSASRRPTPQRSQREIAPVPQRSQRPGSAGGTPVADEGERDQSLGAEGEAKSLLDLLVEGGNLEIEGDDDVDVLVPGVAKILALPMPAEAKATRLSTWLLAQDNVADLFIADEDLAEILERW